MPKYKKYSSLSRSQKYRRLQKMGMHTATTSICPHAESTSDGAMHQSSGQYATSLTDNIDQDCSSFPSLDTTRSICYDAITSPSTDSDELIEPVRRDDSDLTSNDQIYEDNNTRIVASFPESLASWARDFNIAQVALSKLLHILQLHGFEALPISARTLLRTPRSTITQKTASGSYFHYGLEKALQDQLKITNRPVEAHREITINLNIDGLPIAKSSKSQLWPILGQIFDSELQPPFLIGVFHGFSKPSSPFEILGEFITEFTKLKHEGFKFFGTTYTVTIRAVICDSPAKSFVTCTKGHTGYFGCSKCSQEGEYREHRMLFLLEDSALRTDAEFVNRENEEHHTGISPFESILPMVTAFPLDYMHLVCLGVTKKMIGLWLKGYQTTRLSACNIKKLSQDLISMAEWIPVEFSRKPRGLDEVDRWKATEFRLFLLYLSPAILPGYLPKENVLHFCTLHCAISILCHPTDYLFNNDYAKELLLYFVQTMKLLYGEETIIYNIHNLIHLADDAKLYGPLDSFSAFPFENYMQTLKKLLRKADRPLAQLHNRITEINNGATPQNVQKKLVEPVLVQLRGRQEEKYVIKFQTFQLSSTKKADRCCYSKDGRIMRIKNIGVNGERNCIVQTLMNPEGLRTYPCDSRKLGINVGNQWSEIQIISIDDIAGKVVQLPYHGKFCFFPLLHSTRF